MKTLKAPVGQKLADEMARMMGWKPDKVGKTTFAWFTSCGRYYHCPHWQPHCDYTDCRLVEDFIWENGMGEDMLHQICKARRDGQGDGRSTLELIATSTPLARCQAAYLAWKESIDKPKRLG